MFGRKLIPTFLKNGRFNVIHNRFILYFLLFISIMNLTAYGLIGDFFIPSVFILIGIVTSFFNKNMIVILTISLVASNIIKCGTKSRFNEGMEDKNEADEIIEDNEDPIITPYETKKNTKVKKIEMEGMEEKYKELMSLQDKILGSMGTLEESLKNAEEILKDVGVTAKKIKQ
jgi:hypothetical protein